MIKLNKIFHLAIPCADLAKAKEFYVKMGCEIAREHEDRININFFGDQVVCHLSPDKIDINPQMYPRHFGVTITDKKQYNDLLASFQQKDLPFFAKPFTRFQGKKEEHSSFMLLDPSNNILEFKYYMNEEMIY